MRPYPVTAPKHFADGPGTLRRAQILVIEGLHPFYDERVRDLLDFKIYLDISDDVKFAWKLQVHCVTATMQDALQAVWCATVQALSHLPSMPALRRRIAQ